MVWMLTIRVLEYLTNNSQQVDFSWDVETIAEIVLRFVFTNELIGLL